MQVVSGDSQQWLLWANAPRPVKSRNSLQTTYSCAAGRIPPGPDALVLVPGGDVSMISLSFNGTAVTVYGAVPALGHQNALSYAIDDTNEGLLPIPDPIISCDTTLLRVTGIKPYDGLDQHVLTLLVQAVDDGRPTIIYNATIADAEVQPSSSSSVSTTTIITPIASTRTSSTSTAPTTHFSSSPTVPAPTTLSTESTTTSTSVTYTQPPPSQSPTPTAATASSTTSTSLVMGVVVPVGLVLLAAIIATWLWLQRRTKDVTWSSTAADTQGRRVSKALPPEPLESEGSEGTTGRSALARSRSI